MDFLNARRMNPTVGDELVQRLAGDLTTHGIEAADDHDARRVVDDDIDAGDFLELRMLPPSRPIIRPFISSLGISTVLVVLSAVCTAA